MRKFERVSKEKLMELGFAEKIVNDVFYNTPLPKRGSRKSAGYDFYAPLNYEIRPGEDVKICTGVRCFMEEDEFLMIVPRSSLGFKYGIRLANTVAIVDADYVNSDNEGLIYIKLHNGGNETVNIKKGDRFCQGIFIKYGITDDDDVTTERNGGIGSSGK